MDRPDDVTSGVTGRRALVADDDPIFRSLVTARLARMSCAVVEAEDGGSAWSKARCQNFDLAIVDFEMPGLEGINLIGCLRGHKSTQHLPIVMCTSRTDGEAMRAAINAGVTSFLTKPLNWVLFDNHLTHLFELGEAASVMARKVERLETVLQGIRGVVESGSPDAAKLAAIRASLDEFATHQQPRSSSIAQDAREGGQAPARPALRR